MALLSDLATMFAPYESGAKVPATGITIAGTDLSDLFAPAAAGAATTPDTGIVVGATDIADLFATIGTTSKLRNEFAGYYADYELGQGDRTASVLLSFAIDGTFSGAARTGRWLAAGLNASLYEIQFALASGDPLTTNGAATFQPLTGARSCLLSVTQTGVGVSSKQSLVNVVIREIATPTNKVEAQVTLVVTAESWGSSPFPP